MSIRDTILGWFYRGRHRAPSDLPAWMHQLCNRALVVLAVSALPTLLIVVAAIR